MKNAFESYIANILLENIMLVMSELTFGKDLSAYIVGGEKRLLRLIEDGKIDCDKPCNKQNGKWYCNAAQVLQHCRCMKNKIKPKSRINEKDN